MKNSIQASQGPPTSSVRDASSSQSQSISQSNDENNLYSSGSDSYHTLGHDGKKALLDSSHLRLKPIPQAPRCPPNDVKSFARDVTGVGAVPMVRASMLRSDFVRRKRPQEGTLASELTPQASFFQGWTEDLAGIPTGHGESQLSQTLMPIDTLVTTLVPQQIYRSPNGASFIKKDDIPFSSANTYGISLGNALDLKGSQDWNQHPMRFFGTATKTTLRIHWPGYERTAYPINVCNDKVERINVTKARLACNVAKGVRKALEENTGRRQSVPGYEQWALCFDILTLLDRVVLSKLCQVSEGSWQPELYFVQESEGFRCD